MNAPLIPKGLPSMDRDEWQRKYGQNPMQAMPLSAEGCAHTSAFCKRGSVNVRFAPKAAEVLRCRKASLCADIVL
jgi:hypothetical protein